MGAIRVLDARVANQIAAGEVVERPASVIKELVENALDAGASVIDVEIEAGGADRIRVTDDGAGMDPDDAVLAFERHATSKIADARDLEAIRSFGFRGEALPSIASVSRTTLTTAAGSAADGRRVRIEGGRRLAVEPAPHPRGTTVEVERLFYNAPARRKFLRSRASETARIAGGLGRLAAAHPAVAFRLRSGGRELIDWPGVPGLRERVTQIAAAEEAASLVEVDGGSGGLRVRGLASPPSLSRSTSRDQHLYVNARPIRDRRLLHAVQDAYSSLLPKGRYPVVYLFLEVPADQVDVNVHPAKSEVRFRRADAVHDLVRDALKEALGAAGRRARTVPSTWATGEPGRGWLAGETRARPGGEAAPATPPAPERSGRRAEPAPPLVEAVPFAPLAQYRETYILASAPDGLMILDQHAAHERILYERLLLQVRGGLVERQRLLFPLTLEVSPAQRQACEEAVDALDSLGFKVSAFGVNAVKVDEIPTLAADARLESLVREMLDEVLEWDRADGVDRIVHRIAASAACHAAVTANQRLEPEQMRRIVVDLMRTDRAMTCPHGRPALLRLPIDRLEREFGRR
ncbi:MAG: DNA mismatch repair endonuclease MutL [Acidobacteriota bacterium]